MTSVPQRAERFRYLGLDVDGPTLRGHYECDGDAFTEIVEFSHELSHNADAVRAVAELWYLTAGLSYYKARAAHVLDVGSLSLGEAGREYLFAALHDGLGEFAFRNDLDLSDVRIEGGGDVTITHPELNRNAVLTPFGGGIDSVVTVRALSAGLSNHLFIVSPSSGTFAPLEETAARMGLDIQRATRTLDPRITAPTSHYFNGHVPVTAMVTLLATVSALATGRGGVVMSNEHSASVPNLMRGSHAINHQWSKSASAERLLAHAVSERCGPDMTVASFLRDRSELWVAREFTRHRDVLSTFRSCNRAFRQDRAARATNWCGECDKCLFIALVLAPFMDAVALDAIFDGSSPLRRSELRDGLRTLVGLGEQKKPFECVGDPDECAVALRAVVARPDYADIDHLHAIAAELSLDVTLDDLLAPQGDSRVPASWIS